MIMKSLIVILVATFILTQTALAEQSSEVSEAAKAERIKAILASNVLKLQRGSGFGNHSATFCNAFYGAMKRADKAIAYVEPVVKTADRNHPGLERYRSCDNYPGPGETTYPGDLRVIGDRAFRLYRIDAARKWKNGLEEIIYGEQIIPVPEDGSVAMFTGYQQIDFEKCEYYRTLGVTPQGIRSHGMKETLNAMVRYREKYYVVKLDRSSSPGMYIQIDLHAYQPDKHGAAFYPLACGWEYLTTTPSGE